MRYILIILIVFIACGLAAQDFSLWSNIRNSSYTLGSSFHIRTEIVPLEDTETHFFYSQGGIWQQSPLNHYSNETYESIISVDPLLPVSCRYRTNMLNTFLEMPEGFPDTSDSLTVMMPGFVEENSTIPDWIRLAHASDDGVGDIDETFPANLDITAQYFSYSDDYFYTAITNNSNSFPLGGLTGPYNFYISLLINPEEFSEENFVAYALIYGNIPVLMSSGLYRLNGFEIEDFERIGNINQAVSDNKLTKSCLIEDITSDPYFGSWPNMSNSLVYLPLTARYSLATGFTIVDSGRPTMLLFDRFQIEPYDNNLPILSNLQLNSSGDYTYINISYFDEDRNFPLIAEVNMLGEIYQLNPLSFDYRFPVVFVATIPDYHSDGVIRFSDNAYDFVELPFNLSVDNSNQSINLPPLVVFPNPASASKGVTLKLSKNENNDIEIFNIKGQKLRILKNIGRETVWDGRDERGITVSNGMYYLRLKNEGAETVQRLLLMK